MKKNQWIIGLIIFGIIIIISIGIVICGDLKNKHEGTSETPNDIILNEDAEEETEFVQDFVTEDDKGNEQDAVLDSETSQQSNVEDSKTSSEADNSNNIIEDGEQDSKVEGDDGEDEKTELPFVPFD